MIFRNGLFQSPGVDYSIDASGAAHFGSFLAIGDVISVVTISVSGSSGVITF
jgi:hypothetical protein